MSYVLNWTSHQSEKYTYLKVNICETHSKPAPKKKRFMLSTSIKNLRKLQ